MWFFNKAIYLSIYLSIYPSIYRSIYLSIHLSINPSIYQSIYLSIYPSIYLNFLLIPSWGMQARRVSFLLPLSEKNMLRFIAIESWDSQLQQVSSRDALFPVSSPLRYFSLRYALIFSGKLATHGDSANISFGLVCTFTFGAKKWFWQFVIYHFSVFTLDLVNLWLPLYELSHFTPPLLFLYSSRPSSSQTP